MNSIIATLKGMVLKLSFDVGDTTLGVDATKDGEVNLTCKLKKSGKMQERDSKANSSQKLTSKE